MNRKSVGALAVTGVIALTLAGCGSGQTPTSNSAPPSAADLRGQTLEVAGIWSGDEQKAFERVISLFEQQTGATVHYTSDGDQLPTVLQSKVTGKNPPNIAFLGQPGSIASFAKEGALKPLPPDVQQAVAKHQSKAWADFATVDGKPYGAYFDANDKSIIWYDAKSFGSVGAQEPATWSDFLTLSKQLADAGTTPMSIGGADGWVLTDWFEQVYLQTAGVDAYNKLARHEIKWTDQTVLFALQTLQQYFGDDRLIAGGRSGALQTGFPTSVVNTFSDHPKAAMVYEGNFVATTIQSSTTAKLGTDAKLFPFPKIANAVPGVETGGDAAVAFTDDKATWEFMKFLASPEAASTLIKSGGFLTPNKDVPLSDFPDDTSRTMERQLLSAGDAIVFDLSDLAPPAFGATKGSGEWKDLEDFLANPSDVVGTQQKLEADAAKAYPAS
ncbi:ABC transporter substrate-binding protein [Amycolatopsis sp. cmx-4-61]|uniref:ABC transporter substrate-binding protein n=1 Tax=Amycolatopsis sp. cmx-4-61 TaxID=2790937 RepID=UPI003978E0CB